MMISSLIQNSTLELLARVAVVVATPVSVGETQVRVASI